MWEKRGLSKQSQLKVSVSKIKLHEYSYGSGWAFYVYHLVANNGKIKLGLFNPQDKTWQKSNVLYRAECTCGETHIGKTKRDFTIRKAEHENKTYNSQPARHVAKHPTNAYTFMNKLNRLLVVFTHMEHCVHREGK